MSTSVRYGSIWFSMRNRIRCLQASQADINKISIYVSEAKKHTFSVLSIYAFSRTGIKYTLALGFISIQPMPYTLHRSNMGLRKYAKKVFSNKFISSCVLRKPNQHSVSVSVSGGRAHRAHTTVIWFNELSIGQYTILSQAV